MTYLDHGNNNTITTIALAYNVDGQRSEYALTPQGQPTLDTQFQYRNGELAEQTVISDTASGPVVIYTNTYLYGPQGEPLELLHAQPGQTTARYWYVLDGQGSVVALTDANRVVVDRYAYDQWGEATSNDQPHFRLWLNGRGEVMIIDWADLADELGVQGRGGTIVAEQAIEHLLGNDAVANAVAVILDLQDGWLLADSVLIHVMSPKALALAYTAYKASQGERAVRAVWLIKELRHPVALPWISEFLDDPNENIAALGAEVLDQLIFSSRTDPDSPEVENLLVQAEAHASVEVREIAASTRTYLKDWLKD